MFTWYRRSVVCYAYLEDLDHAAVLEDKGLLGKSRWFTRGWTLQELIAPSILVFYGAGWGEIGSRDTLVAEIAAATHIDAALFAYGNLHEYSVAQRMSWAARRMTTRVEDEAYCLLGIFGVNMPLVYGEGMMAFVRLQEEIMRRSADQSIFAWGVTGGDVHGLLAPSVSCFIDAGDIVLMDNLSAGLGDGGAANHQPFFLTNKGIQITLPVTEISGTDLPPLENMVFGGAPKIAITPPDSVSTALHTPPDSVLVRLNCRTRSHEGVALLLERDGWDDAEGVPYRRIGANLGALYLSSRQVRAESRQKTIMVRALDKDTSGLYKRNVNNLPDTFFAIRRHAESQAGYELVRTMGLATTEVSGLVGARLSSDERAGAIFAEGDDAFGVLLRSSSTESSWRLIKGSKTQLLDRDDHVWANMKPLSNCVKWRLPLLEGSEGAGLEVLLEARERPYGYLVVFKVQERTGLGYITGPVEVNEEPGERKTVVVYGGEGSAGDTGLIEPLCPDIVVTPPVEDLSHECD